MLVGHCDDPTPEERRHIYDALDMRTSLDLTKCDSNEKNEDCRSEFKRVLTSHRSLDNGGWNSRSILKALIPSDHGITFSTPSYDVNKNSGLVDDNDSDGYWDNPIHATTLACTSSKDREPFVYTTDCTLDNVANSNYSGGATVELNNSITVTCDEGYWGGGVITCGDDNAFDKTAICQLNTLYVENDFHCDINGDGVEDEGEVIDYENSSMVAIAELTGGSSANDYKVTLPVAYDNNVDLDIYVDWGDGNCDRITPANTSLATHTYSDLSKYRIGVKGTVGTIGSTSSSSTNRNSIKNFWRVYSGCNYDSKVKCKISY